MARLDAEAESEVAVVKVVDADVVTVTDREGPWLTEEENDGEPEDDCVGPFNQAD